MGFLRSAIRVLGDVTSLGGTARIRFWADKHRELHESYQRLCSAISLENRELLRSIKELKQDVRQATSLLRKAGKMLDPLRQGQKEIADLTRMKTSSGAALVKTLSPGDPLSKELVITAGGLTVGGGTTVASWGAVQVLAHASTGTAMATLHGAAAANAGWAWFGGGSLAAGGGGMALGHLILPGIGTAVAVTFSSVVAHKEANRLARLCEEIEETNSANRNALRAVQSNVSKVRGWERLLETEYELLTQAVRSARQRLFRFGILTHIWRLFRARLGGEYYRSEEFPFVDALDSAVVRFFDAFRTL